MNMLETYSEVPLVTIENVITRNLPLFELHNDRQIRNTFSES